MVTFLIIENDAICFTCLWFGRKIFKDGVVCKRLDKPHLRENNKGQAIHSTNG